MEIGGVLFELAFVPQPGLDIDGEYHNYRRKKQFDHFGHFFVIAMLSVLGKCLL